MFQIDQTKASKKNAEKDAPSKCAACGKGAYKLRQELRRQQGNENDSTITGSLLKRCTACYSVRYCGVECQKSHRKRHKKDCKEIAKKRRDFNAVLFQLELKEEDNAPTPPPPLDCDLCMYRMPSGAERSKYFGCCGKIVCRACFARALPGNPFSFLQNGLGSAEEFLEIFGPNGIFSEGKRKEQNGCPFCRSPDDAFAFIVEHHKIREKRLVLRANKGDARAMLELAQIHQKGTSTAVLDKLGVPEKAYMGVDYIPQRSPEGDAKALEYFKQSAALGNGDAYYELSKIYRENYDAADFFDCLVKAADLGIADARNELASLAMEKKQMKAAMYHYKCLAAAGYSKDATEMLTAGYKEGHITKEELASSLRAYQSAREELASEERTKFELMSAGVSPDGKLSTSGLYL